MGRQEATARRLDEATDLRQAASDEYHKGAGFESGVFEAGPESEEAMREHWKRIRAELYDFGAKAESEKLSVMSKLKKKLLGNPAVTAVLMLGAVMTTPATEAQRPAETQEGAETTESRDGGPVIDMTELHPGATPENVQRLLRTYPSGWAKDVKSIVFDPTARGKTDTDVTKTTAINSTSSEGDYIKFMAVSGDNPRMALASTLTHEIVHSNDWETSPLLSAEEKQELKGIIDKREGSEDRLETGYLKDLRDKKSDVLTREYYAELGEAFFNVDSPAHQLPVRDIKAMNRAIEQTDPDYDAEAAALKRKDVLDQIFSENFLGQLDGFVKKLPTGIIVEGRPVKVDAHLKDKLKDAWMTWRFGDVTPSQGAAGRQALAEFYARWGGDEKTAKMARILVEQHRQLQEDAKTVGDGIFEGTSNIFPSDHYLDAAELDTALAGNRGLDATTAAKIRGEFAELVQRHGLRSEETLLPGEYEKLLDLRPGQKADALVEAAGFHAAKQDRALESYVKSHSFQGIDDAKRGAGTL